MGVMNRELPVWVVVVVVLVVIAWLGWALSVREGDRSILCSQCGSIIQGRNRRAARRKFALHMREEHGQEWMP